MENLKDLDLEAHGNGVFIKNSSTNIAIITPCGDRGITESRAKLFAAAPQLLDALLKLQYAVKHGGVKGLFEDEKKLIDNAINKAIGE